MPLSGEDTKEAVASGGTGTLTEDEKKMIDAMHILGIKPNLERPADLMRLLQALQGKDPGKVEEEAVRKTGPGYFPKLSIFYGEDGKGEASWPTFKYEVESLLREKLYSKEQIHQGIRRSLKGGAGDKLRRLGQGVTVEEVMEKLDKDYGTFESKETVMRNLYSCQQKSNESVESFATRLEELFDKAAKLGSVNRSDLKDVLHSGLRKELKHMTIYQKERLHHYDDFKREVRKIEADLKSEDSPEPKKPCKPAVQQDSKSELSEVKELLLKMNERIDTLEREKDQSYYQAQRGRGFGNALGGRGRGPRGGYTTPYPQARGRGVFTPSRPVGRRAFEPTCFLCNQKGHIQRNCPTLNSRLCYNCQKPGHISRDCPNAYVPLL